MFKLQYISQGNTVEEQTRNIHQALDGGCKWVQLRYKSLSDDAFTLAEAAKILCENIYIKSTIMSISPNKLQQMACIWIN
jgi:thiamine-phosphate pyrophosphorylase